MVVIKDFSVGKKAYKAVRAGEIKFSIFFCQTRKVQNSKDSNHLTLSLHEMMFMEKETKLVNHLLTEKVCTSCFLKAISSFDDMVTNFPLCLNNNKVSSV